MLPDVLLALDLERAYDLPEVRAASLRAGFYHRTLHDYRQALRWYRWANELSKQVHPLVHPILHMKEILECLDALGRKSEAEEVRKRYRRG